MSAITIILIAAAAVYALWAHYVLIMALWRAKRDGTLATVARVLGYPPLLVGVILDVLCNLTVCTVLLVEFPREWLVTDRLKRHKRSGGWRGRISSWVCTNLLDAFDPSGCHCD